MRALCRGLYCILLGLLLALVLLHAYARQSLPNVVLVEPRTACEATCPTSKEDFLAMMPARQVLQSRVLPRFTSSGYLLIELPRELHADLAETFERERTSSRRPEAGPHVVIYEDEALRPELTPLHGTSSEAALRRWLQQALQQWTGLNDIKHSQSYGVRTYKRGSKLEPHVYRLHTHVLSAIIHVARKGLEKEWALDVLPHDKAAPVSVLMSLTANSLLYESATLPHARFQPLEGDEYSNIFIHFRPSKWHQVVARSTLA